MSSFFGIKGKRGRHLSHVAGKRAAVARFGSRRKMRSNKRRGWAT